MQQRQQVFLCTHLVTPVCHVSLMACPAAACHAPKYQVTTNTTGCSYCSIMQYKHVVGATADDNRDSLVSPAAKRARTDKLEKAAKKSLRVQVSMPAMFQRDVTKEQVSTADCCLPCTKPKKHPYGHGLWRKPAAM